VQVFTGGTDVWGVNASNEIFRFNPNSQLFEQIPGSLVQIAIGLGSGVWGINASNEIFKFFEDIVIH
jgi:hypothetical protein